MINSRQKNEVADGDWRVSAGQRSAPALHRGFCFCTFPPLIRRDANHGPRQARGMDLPIPAFGDVVGLRRLYRAAVENIRQMDIPEAEKRAWIAELTRRYRAAMGEGATRS